MLWRLESAGDLFGVPVSSFYFQLFFVLLLPCDLDNFGCRDEINSQIEKPNAPREPHQLHPS